MRNKDYDKIGDKYVFYCPICGCQTKPKEIE